jgi:hypothetical protein
VSIIKNVIYSDPIARVITALLCLMSIWFSVSFLLWKFGVTDSNLSGMLAYIGAFIGFIVDSYLFNYYDKNIEIKYPLQKYWAKWYVRYSFSLLYVSIAIALFMGWSSGSVNGKAYIIVNPVIASLFGIIAIVKSYELALGLITIAMFYLLYIGVTALPVSIAIILGAVIIAWAVRAKQ